jgi:hypothetical protein
MFILETAFLGLAADSPRKRKLEWNDTSEVLETDRQAFVLRIMVSASRS